MQPSTPLMAAPATFDHERGAGRPVMLRFDTATKLLDGSSAFWNVSRPTAMPGIPE